MKNRNKVILVLVIFSPILILFFMTCRKIVVDYYSRKDCFNLRNRIIVEGEIVSYKYWARHLNIEFKYVIKGKVYYNRISDDFLCIYCTNHFIHKTFPVITCAHNPEVSEILITDRRFAKYNIPYPDSLEWVKEYSD